MLKRLFYYLPRALTERLEMTACCGKKYDPHEMVNTELSFNAVILPMYTIHRKQAKAKTQSNNLIKALFTITKDRNA